MTRFPVSHRQEESTEKRQVVISFAPYRAVGCDAGSREGGQVRMQKIVLHRPPRGPVGVDALLPSARSATFFSLVSGAIGILDASWDNPG